MSLALIPTAAIVFTLFRDRLGESFLIGLLGVMGMIGIGYLFANVIGFIQIAQSSDADDLSRAFLDTMGQGVLVTDQKGRVVYANRAYAEMTGAETAADIKTVENLLSDSAAASETVMRLAAGLRDGQPGDGEFRLPHPLGPATGEGARWYRLRARTFRAPGHRTLLSAWQIADISAERAEQERFFLDLQKAIDHLDHAPAGFFAADPEGRITYVNATLADWLGVDLANFTPGTIRLSEIVAGDGMALVRSVKTEPGTTRDAIDVRVEVGDPLDPLVEVDQAVLRQGGVRLARTRLGDASRDQP
jgi:two-component system, cell cycle sensor histidine kinase and response regulator CckA